MNYKSNIKLSKLYHSFPIDKTNVFIRTNESVEKIVSNLPSDITATDLNGLESFINKIDGLFSIIIDSEDYVFSAVDCVSSRPLYYKNQNQNLFLSDNPRKIKTNEDFVDTESLSFHQFNNSGYVYGKETLIQKINQLLSGEMLFFKKNSGEITLRRYFKFYPVKSTLKKTDRFIHLDKVCNQIFKKIINRSNNEKIAIPLSGGYDSRFILSKLCELGAQNLLTFSYGNKQSHELQKAKRYSEKFNIEWLHINVERKDIKDFLNSETAKSYFDFSDGLRTIPTLSDFFSIQFLLDKRKINEKSIIINGQSGDFTTGNHINSNLLNADPDIKEIARMIYGNHYSIFSKTSKNNFKKEILNQLSDQLEDLNKDMINSFNPASLYECWEWQERQSKYVVNGQKVYDFFGVNWELPLWEPAFVKYWNNIPAELRFKQSLFREYLIWYDFNEIFSQDNSDIKERIFPGKFGPIIQLFDKLTAIFPKKLRLMKYLSYFSHYSFLYKYFSFKNFLFEIPKINCPPQGRGVMGMLVNEWKRKNKKHII